MGAPGHSGVMIRRLLGGSGSRLEPVAPRVPAGSRVYAIGDIHGRVDLLRELHQLIHEDAYRRQATRNVLIYLGDYIDRGDHSAAVIDFLLDEPLPTFECVYLKGNHEDVLLQFLADLDVGPHWLAYGGAETLRSYGVEPPDAAATRQQLARAQAELARRLPERHRRFMAAMPLSHVEGDYFFVHAGVKPGVPLARQSDKHMLWIRDEFLESDAEHGKIVVHGHSISPRPDVRRNRIGIDTGAFASGRLTCLYLDGTDWGFLQT